MCTSCEMKVQPEERPLCWCSVQLHEHVAQRSGSGRELAGDVLLCSIRGSPGTVLCPNSGLAIILGNQQVTTHASCWNIYVPFPGLLTCMTVKVAVISTWCLSWPCIELGTSYSQEDGDPLLVVQQCSK